MSTQGGGRLGLLWSNAGYPSYEDFCLGEPEKIRDMRRVFMMASGWVFRRHVQYLNSETFQVTLSGDIQADEDVRDAFYTEWDSKRWCCVPPGMCKELKLMGVSSTDLKSADWRVVMHSAAAALQLSMADVEAMHSRNRLLARNAFHAVSSRSINDESKRYMQEAVDLQVPKETTRFDTHATDQKVSKNSGLNIYGSKPKACKSQSALEIFRKRFLHEKQLVDKINPCSKEAWNDVRDAFGNLSQQQMDVYTRMAEESRTNAKIHRAQRKTNPAISTGHKMRAQSTEMVSVKESPLIHAQVVPLWKLSNILAEASSTEQLACGVAKHFEQGQIISKQKFPLCEGSLETAFRGLAANHVTGKQAETTFRVESERIARPPPDDVFPDRVTYEGVCGSLCRFRSDCKRVSMHQHIESSFREAIARKGGVKQAVTSDLLCCLADWCRYFSLF